jgi:hypothetical protein
LVIRPPPDLLVTEPFQATLNLWQEVFGEVKTRTRNELLACVIHDVIFSQVRSIAKAGSPNR